MVFQCLKAEFRFCLNPIQIFHLCFHFFNVTGPILRNTSGSDPICFHHLDVMIVVSRDIIGLWILIVPMYNCLIQSLR